MKIIFSLLVITSTLYAQDNIIVKAKKEKKMQEDQSTTSDSASLLLVNPGLTINSAGGISSLPSLRGLADDRINIQVDDIETISSCPNHMNPILSYVSPERIESVEIMPGVSPVSFGGDNIAGTIKIKTSAPKYDAGVNGKITSFYRTNNQNFGVDATAAYSNENWEVVYHGRDEQAESYKDGADRRVKGTLFKRRQHEMALARKLGAGNLRLKVRRTEVPYQGFVNQYMDMTGDAATAATLNYDGRIFEMDVESVFAYQKTDHYMNQILSERAGNMPMNTKANEKTFKLKVGKDWNQNNYASAGIELNLYRLDDWWSPVAGSMMMGPGIYQSINDGKRDRYSAFIENETVWNKKFSSIVGVRADIISMDTGDVAGYNNTNNLPADAADFNSKNHDITDENIDATVLTKYVANAAMDFEVGFARKNRSPNMYERYAWAGTITDPGAGGMAAMSTRMDMLMINWFGDGNGYVGNLALKPETAHTISASAKFHDSDKKTWFAHITPFYSQIDDYIDVDLVATSGGANYLQFANHDAVLFGSELHVGYIFGDFTANGIVNYTRGYRENHASNLYHIMPLHARVRLDHEVGIFKSGFTVHMVQEKTQVSSLRLEPETAGHTLVDLHFAITPLKSLKIELNATNIFDKSYGRPMGGIDLVNYGAATHTSVQGMGRSLSTAISYLF